MRSKRKEEKKNKAGKNLVAANKQYGNRPGEDYNKADGIAMGVLVTDQ